MPNLDHVVNSRGQANWELLLEQALTVEGSLGNTYNRFYEYSLGNQLLLMLQRVNEPVNTFKRWHDMNRYVVKGAKAKAIMVPLIYKVKQEDGTEKPQLRGFKLKNCLFTVSDTRGEDLPEPQPREWSKERAIGKLALTEVPFTLLEANTQGYSFGRNIAISPVAAYPMKTWLHEASHIVSDHTTPEGMAQYRTHRGVMELEAEGSAYLLGNELEVVDADSLSESRAYIRGWLSHREAPETSIRRIFKTADTILQAGRAALCEEAAPAA